MDLALRSSPISSCWTSRCPRFDGFQTAQALRQQGSPPPGSYSSPCIARTNNLRRHERGGHGYVLKARIYSDLASAIEHAFEGRRFAPFLTSLSTLVGGQHTLQFLHMNDRFFLDEVSRFVGSALRSGELVVVVADETTRDGVAHRLRAQELILGRLESRGQFVAHDSATAVSRVMHGAYPNRRDVLTEMIDDLERPECGNGRPARPS